MARIELDGTAKAMLTVVLVPTERPDGARAAERCACLTAQESAMSAPAEGGLTRSLHRPEPSRRYAAPGPRRRNALPCWSGQRVPPSPNCSGRRAGKQV